MSLRARAVVGLAAGLLTLSGLLAFLTVDEVQLGAAQTRVANARQLQEDEADLARAMNDQRSGIEAFGASGKLEQLAPYLVGSAILANSHEALARDARGTRLSPVAAEALARADRWQQWAERFRDLVDTGGRDAKPPDAGEGPYLYSRFQAADDELKAQAAAGRAAADDNLRSAGVRHHLGLLLGIASAAVALLLVSLALLRSTLIPVERLTRAAEQLAAGRPAELPYAARHDEVGRLAGSLRSWQQTAAEDRSVFDHAPIGICRVGPDGAILDANPSLLQILGLAAGDLPGLWFPSFSGTPDPEAWRRLRQGELVSEREYGSPSGPKWCRLTAAPVPGQTGATAYWVGMLEDVTIARRQADQLRHLAAHDSLTGLPNRRLLLDRLEQALLDATRTGASTALMVIDLDGFKAINDGLGHQAGDAALREVARRFQAALRASDTVARLGGDEFAVVLRGQSEEGATRAAAKLLGTLKPPVELAGGRRRLGASIGVVTIRGAGDADALMVAADAAMYAAKRSGGGYRLAEIQPALSG